MKKVLLFAVSVLCIFTAKAQITVSGGTGATASSPFSTLSAAITAINAGGALTAPVVVDVPAGHSETLTGKITLTMTGTAANTLTIQKSGSGANPYLTSYTGTVATPSNVADGFFVLAGVDYVTIDGIDLVEAAGNTTTTTVMEFGYGLFKASVTDGCQYNTIKNCTITLNRVQNTGWTAPGHNGSVGIAVNNGLYTASGAITPTAASGSNSYNKFYSNTIQNCNAGISFVGYAAASPYTLGDTGNDVGGTSSTTGNTIQNFGGGAASNPATGIFANQQWGFNCSYNTLNNNTGIGVNHATTLRGIFLNSSSAGASVNCNYNTVTLKGGGTTSLLVAIDVEFGSTAASNTVNVNNNTVTGSTYTTATSGAFTGILTVSSATTVNVNNNTVTGTTLPGTGQFDGIVMQSTPANGYMNGNTVSNNTKSSTGTMNCLYFSSTPTNFTANSNTVSGNSMTGASGTLYGMRFGTSIINADGNSISNLSIPSTTGTAAGVLYGMYSLSSPTVENFTNNTITGLSIGGTSTSTSHILNGIRTNSISGASKNLSGNIINNLAISGSGSGTVRGINTTTGNVVSVNKNRIGNLSSVGASGNVAGIEASSGTTVTMSNNIIGDLRAPNVNTANTLMGITIGGGTTMNLYHNTVYLNGSSTGALFGSSALSVSTTPTLNLINNILVNNSSTTGAGLATAYRRSSTTLTTYGSTSDRNLLYGSTFYTDGTNTDATLAAYKTRVSTRDANSISENPTWVSTTASDATFLHINTSVATAIEGAGTYLASVPTDYDGDTRNATTPDIGADEGTFTPLSGCSGTPTAGSISGANSVCTGLGTTLTLTGASTDLGISYQWASSTTSGGPYTTILGTAPTQATGALTTTTYYQVTVTCSNGGATATTLEKEVIVNSLPTVTLTPSTSTICMPGGTAVSLTAGGASTYTYNPTSGLTPSSGANVASLPSATTTYTVTGTDANGCINTTTAQVAIGNNPTISSTTATPAAVCTGAQSTLDVIASVPSAPANYTFAGSTGTYSPITGTAVSAAIGDDYGIGSLPIGFTFNYNGVAQTVFGVSSNGMILLGNTAAAWTSGYSSNSLSGTANVISPFWDDNNTTGGSVQYLTTGTAPNRSLTVQWTGMHVGGSGSSTNPTIDVQAVLNENGTIQFNYGPTSAALSGPTASVGITGATVGAYLSVSPATPVTNSTTSTTTSNNSVTEVNLPSGTIYTFTPPSATYSWANSGDVVNPTNASTLTNALTSTTSYTVTVTNGACAVTSTVTVTVNPLSCGAITTDGATPCVGVQSVTAHPSGGGLPYTYVWTEDGNPIGGNTASLTTTSGTHVYECTVTDACSSVCTSSSTVTTYDYPTVTSTPASVTLCGSGSVTLAGSGATSYVWSGGITDNTAFTASATQTYTVTGTANGCSATASATVTVNPAVTGVTASASSSSVCQGSTFDLTSTSDVAPSTLLTESFEAGATGWLFQDSSSTGSALASQLFHIENAPYTNASGAATFSGYSMTGSKFAYSNSDEGGNGSVTRTNLESPTFSTVGYTGAATLTFKNNYRYYSSGAEQVQVQISTNGGSTWSTLIDYNGANVGTTTNNAQVPATSTVSIPSTYMGYSNVKIRFRYRSAWGYFWAIDDISITGTPITNTYAWTSTPSGFTSSNQNESNVLPSTNTTYTVTVTNSFSCTATATTSVTLTSSPDIALSTSGNASSTVGAECKTMTQSNSATLTYSSTSCNVIADIADNAAGSGLGSTAVCANVAASNPIGPNGQVYAPRYVEITPSISEAADVTVYFTQADFTNYNAGNGSLLDFPTSASDPNVANVIIAQVVGGPLATGSITAITPTSVTWDATNSKWSVVFPASALGGYYYAFSNPTCNYTMPTATVSNITSSTAQFDWTSAGSGLTYDWRYRVQGATTWTNAGTGTSAVTRTFTGLAANTTYEFQGKVRCGAGLSGLYGSTVTFTTAMGPCTTPTGLAYSGLSSNSVTLSWAAMSAPVTSYVLRYRVVGSGTWMNAGVTTNTKTISGLTPGSNYEAQIASYCSAAGTLTAYSSSVNFTTTIACPVTTNLTYANATSNSVQLNWDAMGSPVTSYVLSYRVVGSGTWSNAGVTTNTKTLYGLTAGTDYEAIVKSYCSASGTLTAASNTVNFTTAAGCPQTSNISSSSVTTTQASLSWTDVSTATSGNKYVLRYRVSPSGSWINAGCPSYLKTIYGLTANTSYDVQVQTVCAGGVLSTFTDSYTFATPSSKPEDVTETAPETANTFAVYPNPTSDVISVQFYTDVNQTTTIKVYDLTGRLMKQVSRQSLVGNNSMDVNLGEFANGVYTIQVYENNNLTHTARVRKNN